MIKPKTFRPWLPGQTHLMPPSPIEWLPSDHLVFFLLDLLTARMKLPPSSKTFG